MSDFPVSMPPASVVNLGTPYNAPAIQVVLPGSSPQQIPDGVLTDVLLSHVQTLQDPEGVFSLNPATGVLTIKQPGYYLYSAQFKWSAVATGGRVGLIVGLLAGELARTGPVDGDGALAPVAENATAIQSFKGVGTIKLQAFQSSGAQRQLGFASLTAVQLSRIST